jgi:peptide/nickel transport system permease protein
MWHNILSPLARLAKQGGRSTQIGLLIISIYVAVALLAPWISPYNPTITNLADSTAAPSLAHPLGTDAVGRDVLSRIIFGSRVSLSIGITAIALGILIGTGVGLVAGYTGGWVDYIVSRIVDLLLSFPYLLIAIIVVIMLGTGIVSIIIAIAIRESALLARIMRGEVLSAKARPYVLSARAVGGSGPRIALRHILPNAIPTVLVLGTLDIGSAILTSAALGFIGLGVQPPTPEWGTMMGSATAYFLSDPYLMFFPGFAILIAVVGFNLLGDGLRDLLDPRFRLQAEARASM